MAKQGIRTEADKSNFFDNMKALRKKLKEKPVNVYRFGTAYDDMEERFEAAERNAKKGTDA